MFLDSSKSRSVQLPIGWFSCFLIGLVGFATGLNAPYACGQPVQNQGGLIIQQPIIQQPISQQPINQQPLIVQPTQTFQGQGQIIQQPFPAPGFQPGQPIIQGNGTQPIPPIVRTTPQPQDDNAKKALEAERAAYTAAKLEVEKLLEKNKALMVQNEGASEQFESLKVENAGLTKRMGELNKANQRAQATVVELQEKLEAAGESDPAAMKEAEQLKINYMESVNQVKNLTARVESLTTENEGFRVKISDLTAAQEEAMKARPDERNLSELTELNQALTADNKTLAADKQTLAQSNQTLLTDKQALTEANQALTTDKQSLAQDNQTLTDRIAELSTSNEGYVSKIASLSAGQTETVSSQPTVSVAGFESKIAQLTRKNRDLVRSSSEFEDENRSLRRQLASLEANSATFDNDLAGSLDVSKSDVLAVAAPVVDQAIGPEAAKSSVLGWLIPFLVLGLGIAFFVILREEVQRPATGSVGRDQKSNR